MQKEPQGQVGTGQGKSTASSRPKTADKGLDGQEWGHTDGLSGQETGCTKHGAHISGGDGTFIEAGRTGGAQARSKAEGIWQHEVPKNAPKEVVGR